MTDAAAAPLAPAGHRPDPGPPGGGPHSRTIGPSRGYALVLLGAGLFVVNAGVSRLVLDAGVDPALLASVRSVGTATVLGAFVLVSGRARRLRLRRHEVALVLAYGILGVAAVQWLYFVAIDRLPIGVALLLEYQAPLLIALWARFVQRRPVGWTLWPALGMALLGLAMVAQVTSGGADLDPVGVAAALGAAVAFGVYFVTGERLVAHRDVVTTSFWGFLVAAAAMVLLAPPWTLPPDLLSEQVALPAGFAAAAGAPISVAMLLGWVVVLGTVVPFAAETAALRYLPATAVSLVATLEPVGAAMLAWWWFDEAMAVDQLVGVLLVCAGIALAVLARAAPAAGDLPLRHRRAAGQ